MLNSGVSPALNARIITEVAKYRADPLGFVLFAFPWGAKGTVLEGWPGPQQWQREVLQAIGEVMANPDKNQRKIRVAIASGKGIGKSALLAMIFWWAMTTMPFTRARVTAGSFPQLSATTWPEIVKWGQMSLCSHWFHITAQTVSAMNEADSRNWRADAMAWNETAPESFAGLHNLGRRILFIMDEASQIATPIWDTTDGIFTDKDTEIILVAPGNPTRGTGRFFDLFQPEHPEHHRWLTRNIDSRDVDITDKDELNSLVEQYGEDHDYVRAFVRGVFPRLSDMQFISAEAVWHAVRRNVAAQPSDPLVMGVDVARSEAGDETVIAFRKGFDAKLIPWIRMRSGDTMAIASAVADAFQRYRADALFVDGGGVGGGVHDRLLQLGVPSLAIDSGRPDDRASATTDPTRYANKRAAMWGAMKHWLPYGALPDDHAFTKDFVPQASGVMYGHSQRKGVDGIVLEAKKDMKKRGLSSPDLADALAFTFAYRVTAKQGETTGGPQHAHGGAPGRQAASEYDPFA